LRAGKPHGPVFFHTQTISLFAPAAARGAPYVVSVDATPLQVDSMARWYRHRPGPDSIERAKKGWYRSVLGRAAAVVAWSDWAAMSLERDYGVPRDKVLVAHPTPLVRCSRCAGRTEQPVRILFVGGDFERKGGRHLLAAFREVRRPDVELVVVTEADVGAEPGVQVKRGVRPGTPELLSLYRDADIFCLPTLGDCTPVAVEEAMASGLPVVTTTVGANNETVAHGETGYLVGPGDEGALAEALAHLVEDARARRTMGAAARRRAFEMLSAEDNAHRIIDLMVSMA
jgi:glycosyltransferase involved in cell wall biosynthesis